MPRLQSGESRQKAKCREAGAESWELEVGSGVRSERRHCQPLCATFPRRNGISHFLRKEGRSPDRPAKVNEWQNATSRNRRKSTNGKMPRAEIGKSR